MFDTANGDLLRARKAAVLALACCASVVLAAAIGLDMMSAPYSQRGQNGAILMTLVGFGGLLATIVGVVALISLDP